MWKRQPVIAFICRTEFIWDWIMNRVNDLIFKSHNH